jgi:NADP-dependent 3-hydroxy acid dehydrogenase YdfG
MAVRALVFDAYGTLYDVQSVLAKAEALCPGKGEVITQIWRLKQLEYTWLRSLMQKYADFWLVTSAALDFALRAAGVKPNARTVREGSRRPGADAVGLSIDCRGSGWVQPLLNKIVWVTGAGSGIGEAAALTLAKAGGAVVLTGRRREPLETVAHRIRAEGGTAHVEPGDLMDPDAVKRIGAAINDKIGRLDILVNNAGVNINDRHWDKLTPENAKLMIDGNLAAAAQCVTVALPLMRAQQDGLIIHTASMAGRFIGGFPGPLYTAAKHGVVAMSHSINMQECVNGIRSCVFLPGEVATPILDQRPNPVGPEERARMVQPQDCADLILYIALLPKRLTMNEVMLSPTWNRAYVAAIRQLSNL